MEDLTTEQLYETVSSMGALLLSCVDNTNPGEKLKTTAEKAQDIRRDAIAELRNRGEWSPRRAYAGGRTGDDFDMMDETSQALHDCQAQRDHVAGYLAKMVWSCAAGQFPDAAVLNQAEDAAHKAGAL